MDNEKKFEELGKKLLSGEISVEEHVKEYNRLMSEENRMEELGFQPHEYI